jgi:3-oxoacyl-[acyl-carrier-protein] synthase II
MKKIVVTGVGIVSALGSSPKRFWQALMDGEDRFRPITRFETAPALPVCGAEVTDFEAPVPFRAKQPWTGNRSIQFAIAAAQQALDNAGIAVDEGSRSQIGVVFGSTQSCLDLTLKLDHDGIVRGPRTVDPLLFPDANPFAPSCRVSLQLGLTAFNAILSNGPTSGLDAIHYGCNAIRDGLAPVVLAGAVEELSRMTFLFRESLERLNDDQASCAPFAGSGVVLGEGCAVLVLEDEEHARRRRATILAEVSGYGTCFWPEDSPMEWAGQAQGFAMRNAVAGGWIRPEEVDAVFASANGDPVGDLLEAKAVQGLVPNAPLTAIKASLGETHSAAGCFNAAACVLAMRELTIPATRGSDGACSQWVPQLLRQAKHGPVKNGLVNCFSTTSSMQAYSSVLLQAVPEA